MKCTLKTQKYGDINFWTLDRSGGYIMSDLKENNGHQICRGGKLSGVALSYHGTNSGFRDVCKKWILAYNRSKK